MNSKAGATAGVTILVALAASGCLHRSGPPAGDSGSTAPARPAATSSPGTPETGTGQWVSSGGLSLLSAVETDTAKIGADAGNHDLAALTADGPVLRADALSALARPYPGDTADYQLAMGYLAKAGTDLSLGDVAGATTAMDSASAYLAQVQATMNAQGAS